MVLPKKIVIGREFCSRIFLKAIELWGLKLAGEHHRLLCNRLHTSLDMQLFILIFWGNFHLFIAYTVYYSVLALQ